MKHFKLDFAHIDEHNDIPCFEFKKHSDMIDFIDEKCINRNGQVVWLITKKTDTDIFISESHISIQDFLNKKSTYQTVGHYILQEYKSFESAYAVAHSMTEISPLCYD